MMKHGRSMMLGVAMLAASLPSLATAQVTHEDGGFNTVRGAGSAPVGRLTVSSAQSITGFGIDVDLNGASMMQFFIFNSDTGAVLYQSAATSFADNGQGYKYSNPFSFTFNPGTTYGLTATSDTGGNYFVDFTANTVGAFNFLTGNQNVSGPFGSTILDQGTNCCDVGTALLLGPAVGGAVPEPATWGLMILGFGAVGAASRYRRRTAKVAFAA